MSLTESTLEWPRFCYSGSSKILEENEPMAKRRRLNTSEASITITPTLKRPSSISPTESPIMNKNNINIMRPVAKKYDGPTTNFCNEDFTFSNLMKRMAKKYQTPDESNEEYESNNSNSRNLLNPYLNPLSYFLQCYQHTPPPMSLEHAILEAHYKQQQEQQLQVQEQRNKPLDLSGNPAQDNKPENGVEDWTVDQVVEFVSNVETCSEYAQVFREHCIDGHSLQVLSETHLTRILGLKLGPAIKLLKAINKLTSIQIEEENSRRRNF